VTSTSLVASWSEKQKQAFKKAFTLPGHALEAQLQEALCALTLMSCSSDDLVMDSQMAACVV